MQQRQFGKTDMHVSRLGLGSYKMSSKAGGTTVEEIDRLLGAVIESGINVIDTAECYGQAALFAVNSGVFDTLQTSVNIADQEALTLTLPRAKDAGMGIIAKRSLANTAWVSKQGPHDSAVAEYHKRLSRLNYDFLLAPLEKAMQSALHFTLSVPEVDIILIDSTKPEHWQQNAALLAAGPLPSAEFEAIRARWRAATWWCNSLPRHMAWHGWV